MQKNELEKPRRRLLYIAYHFPPLQGSTGIARTLSFAKYLREWGWDVTVLTVRLSAYSEIREANYAAIPDHVRVVRSWALDTQRHLSTFGKYPSLLAVPDKWQSWILSGVFNALRITRSWKPHAIVSTYPIASAHCIGYLTHKFSGIPWIADFRDPMAQPNYPPDPRIHKAFEKIESLAFTNAARIVVTTPGTADLYSQRFKHYPRNNIVTITNGYDPEIFNNNPYIATPQSKPVAAGPLKLLHSGLLYAEERNPQDLFKAIAELRDEGRLTAETINFLFRASGNEAQYVATINELGLDKFVFFLPSISYQEAIAEMMSVDCLLVLQASNCNQQIPAKLYEYLYCAKPILCLTDPAGDTGKFLNSLGVPYIARLDDSAEIKQVIMSFVDDLKSNKPFVVAREQATKFSRQALTGDLSAVLNAVVTT